MDLKGWQLSKIPDTIYYIPNFISEAEEKELLEKVYAAPKPKWTYLSHRRLQNWGGLPHPKGMVAEPLPQWLQTHVEKIFKLGIFDDKNPNHVLVNEYLPGQGIMPHEDGPLFYPVVATISLGSHTLLDFFHHMDHLKTCDFKDGIPPIPTTTDPETNGKETGACHLYNQSFNERHFTSIFLEPRSLILVCDDMYKNHLHGIAERTEDLISDKIANLTTMPFREGDKLNRHTRVSLTIRHVPKVLKSKLLFGKR